MAKTKRSSGSSSSPRSLKIQVLEHGSGSSLTEGTAFEPDTSNVSINISDIFLFSLAFSFVSGLASNLASGLSGLSGLSSLASGLSGLASGLSGLASGLASWLLPSLTSYLLRSLPSWRFDF